MDGRAAALMVLLCLLWGAQQMAVKAAVLDGFPPLLQGGLRSLGAAALTWLWSARTAHGPPRLRAVELLLAALFGCEFVLIYLGLRFTTASRGVLFLYTTPLFVALGAHLLIPGERLTGRRVVGLACAFAGLALAVADGLRGTAGPRAIVGDLLVTGGAILWAATTLLIRRSAVLNRTTPARILLVQLAGSAPILFAASWLLGEGGGALTGIVLLSLFYQIVIVAFASYLVWFWLVAHYPAARLSAFSFLTPIFGIAAGAWLLDEAVSPLLGAALGAVIAGLWLQNR